MDYCLGLRPDGGFGARGGVEGGSLEGGFDEFREFWFNRAFRSSISAFRASICFCCAAINSRHGA
jgi:hypothetical protein